MLLNAIVIGTYFLFLISIGVIFKRLNRDEEDYFKSGARCSWWMVGMSLLMSGISTQTFVANAGVAYNAGFSIYWVYIINALCATVLALGLAAWYRQARVTTFAEMVRGRFGGSFEQLFTYYNIVWLIIGGSIGLVMLALFTRTVFGLPLPFTIIALGVVLLFYTLTGGNWAVMAASFLQGLVLFSMSILLGILCLKHIGGIGAFFSAIHAQGLANDFRMMTPCRPDGLYGIEWLLGVGIIQVYAALGMQGGQRFFSCKDGREAKKAAWFYVVLGLIGMMVYFIPPMVARLMYADEISAMAVQSPADLSFSFMSLKLLPFGFVPLMLVAMFSAQMSTMDTALNANAALFVTNAYPALMRRMKKEPRTDHKFLLALGRVFNVLLGAALIGFALWFAANLNDKGIFELTFRINAILGIPLLMPLFLGFYIRRTPLWSGWFCFGVALTCSVICSSIGLPSYRLALINSGAGLIAFLSTTLFWNRVPETTHTHLKEFFTRLHTPVDFEQEVGDANDGLQLKLVGILAISLGGFILFFLLLPNDVGARFCIFSVASAILGVGAVLYGLSKKRSINS
ncbi:MAG: hypothetical protein AB7E95_07215 [Kiritimatiellales bacterium]